MRARMFQPDVPAIRRESTGHGHKAGKRPVWRGEERRKGNEVGKVGCRSWINMSLDYDGP